MLITLSSRSQDDMKSMEPMPVVMSSEYQRERQPIEDYEQDTGTTEHTKCKFYDVNVLMRRLLLYQFYMKYVYLEPT
jgi:hypothetical protein